MLRRATVRFWLLLFAIALSPTPAGAEWYAARGARPPVAGKVFICHGYGCRIVTPVQLSAADLRRIGKPLARKLKDAAAERQAIARSVQLFETLIGKRVGTSGDLAAMQFGSPRDDQMDCIDEATNTTSLLRVLDEAGYLKHHEAAPPSSRGFFLDGRYPHATAVIAEKGGERWAVDSWPAANGEAPAIQPLSAWLKARSSAAAS